MLGVTGLGVAGKLEAQATSVRATNSVITSIREFWNLTSEERARSHAFRLECDIAFYDPVWKNLWIQDAIEGAYVIVGNARLPMKAGQHVVVSGTFEPPNLDLSFEHATVVSTAPGDPTSISA